MGFYTSIAVDQENHPHISYYDSSSGRLKYASYDGSAWTLVVVDSGGVGRYSSIALDGGDLPVISYAWGLSALKLARYDGGTWQIQTVDTDDNPGQCTSLALDSTGQPHISYRTYTSDLLRYAAYDGQTWHIEQVDSEGAVGEYTSLELDSSNRPHITYGQVNAGDLKYAYHDGAEWLVGIGDPVGFSGIHTSLELDAAGHWHVSYLDSAGGDLRYAYFDGLTWQAEVVDSAGFVGSYSSLALDTSGRPHISYYDATNHDLRYAYNDGATWITATVDTAGKVGRFTSLALDAADRPHIAYYDVTNHDLEYAFYDGTDWQFQTVLATGDVGQYTSLALDAGDQPHIAYYDLTNADLEYAFHDGVDWQIVTVDSTGQVGQYTSLALDAVDDPRISYWDQTGTALKFAYYDGLDWQVSTVDASGSVGTYNSLALDDLGRPAISYYDTTNGALKYAATDCLPVSGARIAGPTVLLVGQVGVYTATALPQMSTPPVTFTWDSGTVGATAAYSWTQPGDYAIVVQAANDCGQGSGSIIVHVCEPVQAVSVEGPTELLSGQTGLYTATWTPITASLPVTVTWDNGTVGSTAAYSWTHPGAHTIAVTATNGCAEVYGTYAVTTSCQPLQMVTIAGPGMVSQGRGATYQALPVPITASTPLTYTWQDASGGEFAVFTWTVTGTYGLAVTGTNPCGEGAGAMSVTVYCQEPASVTLSGPATLLVGQEGDYTVSTWPVTASLPLDYAWDNGTLGPTAVYSWTVPGTYTLTVTATNPCGEAAGNAAVEVIVPTYRIYLPVVQRD